MIVKIRKIWSFDRDLGLIYFDGKGVIFRTEIEAISSGFYFCHIFRRFGRIKILGLLKIFADSLRD